MLGVLPAAVCVLDVRPAGALPGCGSAFDKAVLSTVALQLDWRATTPFIEKTNLLCVKPKTTLHARGGAAGRIRERVFFFSPLPGHGNLHGGPFGRRDRPSAVGAAPALARTLARKGLKRLNSL